MVGPRSRAALFVDFDNIYLALAATSESAAEDFAREPASWLATLSRHPAAGAADANAEECSILVRRCYLNPASFARYRPGFVRAGFEVVDCPPLTANAKNAADICMALDLLDTLHHQTRFEEFILLSGDADFTPVLRRLRAHDRRTTVVSPQAIAGAYRALADRVIGFDLFSPSCKGVFSLDDSIQSRPGGAPTASPQVVAVWQSMAESVVVSVLTEAGGSVTSTIVASTIARVLAPHGFVAWEAVGGFKSFAAGIPGSRFRVDWRVPGWFSLAAPSDKDHLAA